MNAMHCCATNFARSTLDETMERHYEPLTVSAIERIVARQDAVGRNRDITRSYYQLALGMARAIGVENVNWCAFAAWASRTAGSFIRGEHIPPAAIAMAEMLDRVLRGPWRPVVDQTFMASFIARIKDEIARHIACGNRMVFGNIAPLYARMIASFTASQCYDEGFIARFVASLRPGSVAEGGNDLLIAACRNYYRARFESDAKSKAELVLLANNQVAHHEQTRLQKRIHSALNTPLSVIVGHAVEALIEATGVRGANSQLPRLRARLTRRLTRLLRPIKRWLARAWRALATRFMRLELPERSLSLGEDVPSPCRHHMFPTELVELCNPELRALVAELDHRPDTTAGSGANNWADLGDRMNFLVDLFRTHQMDYTLYRDPCAH